MRNDGQYFAHSDACPKVDMRLACSGCDYYCQRCGARHWEKCNRQPIAMYGLSYPEDES